MLYFCEVILSILHIYTHAAYSEFLSNIFIPYKNFGYYDINNRVVGIKLWELERSGNFQQINN